MLKIRIEEGNEQKIQAALDLVQKGARARLLEPKDLIYFARRAEDRFAVIGVPQTARQGARATCGFHQALKHSRYKPFGTIVGIERGRDAWYIEWLMRALCNQGGRNELILTKYQEELVLKHALRSATSL